MGGAGLLWGCTPDAVRNVQKGLCGQFSGKWLRLPQLVQGLRAPFALGLPPLVTVAGGLVVGEWVNHSSHRSLCFVSQRRDLSSVAHARYRASYGSYIATGGKAEDSVTNYVLVSQKGGSASEIMRDQMVI